MTGVVYFGRAMAHDGDGDGEASEVKWVVPDALDTLEPMHPTMRYRLDPWRAGLLPHIDRPGDMANYLDGRKAPE